MRINFFKELKTLFISPVWVWNPRSPSNMTGSIEWYLPRGTMDCFHIRMILWEIEYRRMAYTYNEMNVMKSWEKETIYVVQLWQSLQWSACFWFTTGDSEQINECRRNQSGRIDQWHGCDGERVPLGSRHTLCMCTDRCCTSCQEIRNKEAVTLTRVFYSWSSILLMEIYMSWTDEVLPSAMKNLCQLTILLQKFNNAVLTDFIVLYTAERRKIHIKHKKISFSSNTERRTLDCIRLQDN